MALVAIKSALVDWCAATISWSHTHEPIAGLAGQTVYPLTIPSGARLHRVVFLARDRRDITDALVGEDVAARMLADGQRGQMAWVEPTAPAIGVSPAPADDIPGMLALRMALVPNRTTQEVPDFLLEQYAEEIGHGAAALVLPGPGPHGDEFARRKYAAALRIARGLAGNGGHSKPLRF